MESMGRNKQLTHYTPKSDEPQIQSNVLSVPNPPIDATIIAEDVTALGDLNGTGSVYVNGTVIGKIKLNGTVTVAKTGAVEGPILADTVIVSGTVRGNIAAKEYLRLEMTGSITGDIVVKSFTIEDGGYFSGRSHMTKSGEEPVIEY